MTEMPAHRLGGYVERRPPGCLERYVRCMWTYRPVAGGGPHRVLPTPGVGLGFQYLRRGGVAEAPELLLLGPVRTPRLYTPAPDTVMKAVLVKPEWSHVALSAPAVDHVDRLDDYTAIEVGEGRRLLDRAFEAVRRRESALPVLLEHVQRRILAAGEDRLATVASLGLSRLLRCSCRWRRAKTSCGLQ